MGQVIADDIGAHETVRAHSALYTEDRALLAGGIACLCAAALLYGFVTQVPQPVTAQAKVPPAAQSTSH